MEKSLIGLFAALVLAGVASGQAGDYPPPAEPGQCFARVLSPEITETVREEVLVSPASVHTEVRPAVYETQTVEVMVREQTVRHRVVPAVFETVREEVLVEPERVEKVVIPAEWETYTETVVVEPQRVAWKPGRGLLGRSAVEGTKTQAPESDVATGGVLCRVIVPAKTRDIVRVRLVSPPRMEERVIPARYETVERQVMVSAPRVVEEIVPAVHETREVRVLVEPAREQRVEVPAVYETIERNIIVGGGEMQWAEVLCQTNADRFKIAEIQGALSDAGFPTLIDGIFGPRTQRAMEAFQRSNGLSVGYMTVETVRALDIDPYGRAPDAVYAALGAAPPGSRTQDASA